MKVHKKIIHTFRLVRTAHFILFQDFLKAVDTTNKRDICELWLRYMLNGGKIEVFNIFEFLVKLSDETVDILMGKVNHN